MSRDIDQVTTSDTFQVWLQRTNDLIVELGSSVMTASTSGDQTIGDAVLIGEFTANTVVADGELRTNFINTKQGNSSPIEIGGTVEFTSTDQVPVVITNSLGPKVKIENDNISWLSGLRGNAGTGTDAEYVIGVEGAVDYAMRISTDGVVYASTFSGKATTAAKISANTTGTDTLVLVDAGMANNDRFRIAVGGTATDAGFAEIATADGGNEPIYVRQYTGAFSNPVRTVTLLNSVGDSVFPGNITAGNIIVNDVDTDSLYVLNCLDASSSTGLIVDKNISVGSISNNGTVEVGDVNSDNAIVISKASTLSRITIYNSAQNDPDTTVFRHLLDSVQNFAVRSNGNVFCTNVKLGDINFDSTGNKGVEIYEASTSGGINIQAYASTEDSAPTIRVYRGTSEKFRINSTGNAYNTNGIWGTLSDRRVKQDITPASSQWNDIKNIKLVNYRLISDVEENGAETAKVLLGVIAQDLIDSGMNGLVEQDDDGFYTVKTTVLLTKALGALKEAMLRIEQLEDQIAIS